MKLQQVVKEEEEDSDAVDEAVEVGDVAEAVVVEAAEVGDVTTKTSGSPLPSSDGW